MSRRTTRSRQPSSSVPPTPSLEILAERFYQRLQIKNYATSTIKLRREYLTRFLTWCEERGIQHIEQITREVLQSYQRYLFHFRSRRTQLPLKFSTQLSLLIPIRAWFRFLLREELAVINPTSDLELPKDPRRLPNAVLSAEQSERILDQPDITTALGIRDRALLETLYSTAIRRSELIHLQIYDVDAERGVVSIRQGKGRKDRVVPIGQRALQWIDKYVTEVRPALVEQTLSSTLFVSYRGRPLGTTNVSIMVRGYITAAGITHGGSCHLFRHAAATQMLENGADLRSLQALLGHEQLTTTQIYTHISIAHLKQVHAATHPADLPVEESDEQDTDSTADASGRPEDPVHRPDGD